jgi:hypothetical protein
VREDRPFGGTAIRRPISPIMRGFSKADAYSGYNKLYEPDRKPSPILEAACWVQASMLARPATPHVLGRLRMESLVGGGLS